MSKNLLAVVGILAIVTVIVSAVVMGVERGSTLFQAVGAVLLFIALAMFFTKKEGK